VKKCVAKKRMMFQNSKAEGGGHFNVRIKINLLHFDV
jgi:hypothetical protein